MAEVSTEVYKKALALAPTLYEIWHCTGHETPWEDLSGWERDLMIRCAEQTVLAIAPGNPPRYKENPYL